MANGSQQNQNEENKKSHETFSVNKRSADSQPPVNKNKKENK